MTDDKLNTSDTALIGELEADRWNAADARRLLLLHYRTMKELAARFDRHEPQAAVWTREQTWPIPLAILIRKDTKGAINERYLCKKLHGVS